MKYIMHAFKQSETIQSVIHLKNNHDVTKDEMLFLMAQFNVLNNQAVPTLGVQYKIPKVDRHCVGDELSTFDYLFADN